MQQAYARYGPALMRKARRLLQNEADAADLVQSLFVHLWQQHEAKGEQARDCTLPLLYRALTNRALNFIRDRNNQARLLELQQPALRGMPRVMPDAHTLSLEALTQLSNMLTPVVFETLVYRYFDEMGQQEIADLMEVSRKTVQKRLHNADSAITQLRAQNESQEAP